MLADTDIQDQLSVVYLSALATAAGYTFAVENLDRTGTDMIVRGGRTGFPQIDWQIKATKNLAKATDGKIAFPLKRRNYDLLIEKSGHPRLLMIYDMPSDKSEWLDCAPEKLTMKHRAYWMSLKGEQETQNETSVTVYIPDTQLLSVSALEGLMIKARAGDI